MAHFVHGKGGARNVHHLAYGTGEFDTQYRTGIVSAIHSSSLQSYGCRIELLPHSTTLTLISPFSDARETQFSIHGFGYHKPIKPKMLGPTKDEGLSAIDFDNVIVTMDNDSYELYQEYTTYEYITRSVLTLNLQE